MALNPTKLEQDILQLATDMRKKTNEDGDKIYAKKLATLIHEYIMSQTITIVGVTTAGSPTTQTQTAPVIATIS